MWRRWGFVNGYRRDCNSESSLREHRKATGPACGFRSCIHMWGHHRSHSSHIDRDRIYGFGVRNYPRDGPASDKPMRLMLTKLFVDENRHVMLCGLRHLLALPSCLQRVTRSFKRHRVALLRCDSRDRVTIPNIAEVLVFTSPVPRG